MRMTSYFQLVHLSFKKKMYEKHAFPKAASNKYQCVCQREIVVLYSLFSKQIALHVYTSISLSLFQNFELFGIEQQLCLQLQKGKQSRRSSQEAKPWFNIYFSCN